MTGVARRRRRDMKAQASGPPISRTMIGSDDAWAFRGLVKTGRRARRQDAAGVRREEPARARDGIANANHECGRLDSDDRRRSVGQDRIAARGGTQTRSPNRFHRPRIRLRRTGGGGARFRRSWAAAARRLLASTAATAVLAVLIRIDSGGRRYRRRFRKIPRQHSDRKQHRRNKPAGEPSQPGFSAVGCQGIGSRGGMKRQRHSSKQSSMIECRSRLVKEMTR
jgi:hypothetical protein